MNYIGSTNIFIDYLKHFKTTETLYNLHIKNSKNIYLRHDVDHSLESALKAAEIEFKYNCRSSYFLLPRSKYWEKKKLKQAIKQLNEMGHEVGIHINNLAEWYDGKILNIRKQLFEDCIFLKNLGAEIKGCAAHGSVSCYKGSFTNYWIFADLKPENIAKENGINAEGVKSKNRNKMIYYPNNNFIINSKNEQVDLWKYKMSEFGLEYHASHLNFEKYYSDSGGKWLAERSPIEDKLEGKSVQVLMHPEYWIEHKPFFTIKENKLISTIKNINKKILKKKINKINYQNYSYKKNIKFKNDKFALIDSSLNGYFSVFGNIFNQNLSKSENFFEYFKNVNRFSLQLTICKNFINNGSLFVNFFDDQKSLKLKINYSLIPQNKNNQFKINIDTSYFDINLSSFDLFFYVPKKTLKKFQLPVIDIL